MRLRNVASDLSVEDRQAEQLMGELESYQPERSSLFETVPETSKPLPSSSNCAGQHVTADYVREYDLFVETLMNSITRSVRPSGGWGCFRWRSE